VMFLYILEIKRRNDDDVNYGQDNETPFISH
jgi:hypothetical protein